MGEYLLLTLVLGSVGSLGYFVYKNDPKNPSNRNFSYLLFWICIWVLFNFSEAEVTSQIYLKQLFRADFASAAWIALYFLLFCLYFPSPSFNKIPSVWLGVPVGFISLLSLTPLIVKDATLARSGEQPSFALGSVFPLYALVVAGYIFSGMYFMYIKRKRLKGLPKVQATYVLLGMVASGVIAVVINLGLSSFFAISANISRVGIYSILALAWLPGYSIIRYRLMDVRIFIKETSRYLVTSGFIAVGFTVLFGFLSKDMSLSFFVFVLCMVVPYIQNRAVYWFEQQRIKRGIIDPSQIKSVESLADRIKDAGHRISDLAETVVQMVLDEFLVDSCAMFVMNYETRTFMMESQKGAMLPSGHQTIRQDDVLISYLGKNREIFVLSEIKRRSDNKQTLEAISFLEEYGSELCAPLIIFGQVAGFMIVGPKANGQPYFSNETKKLKIIVDEAATALRYVLALSTKANETIKWAHTLHQSLKPLTTGFDFLVRRASAAGNDDNLEKVIPRVRGTIKRLSEFLKFLLQDSRISEEALRNKYELLPVSINEVIQDGVSKHSLTIEAKRVNLVEKYDAPNGTVNGHFKDLSSVIEILISNALRYVVDGGMIKITGKNTSLHYRIELENDGPPIPDDKLKLIFSEGFQVRDGNHGMDGFGLTNASRIIQMHKGIIRAENLDDLKGVKFIIEIPQQTVQAVVGV